MYSHFSIDEHRAGPVSRLSKMTIHRAGPVYSLVQKYPSSRGNGRTHINKNNYRFRSGRVRDRVRDKDRQSEAISILAPVKFRSPI